MLLAPEQILAALDACKDAIACRSNAQPKRCDLLKTDLFGFERYSHLLCMIEEAKALCSPERLWNGAGDMSASEKLMRASHLLSFIQGSLWQAGLVSIEDTKRMTDI